MGLTPPFLLPHSPGNTLSVVAVFGYLTRSQILLLARPAEVFAAGSPTKREKDKVWDFSPENAP